MLWQYKFYANFSTISKILLGSKVIWIEKMPQSRVGSMQGSNEDCLPIEQKHRGGDAPTM